MWKCVKEFLRFKGIECNSPRSFFRELIKEGVLSEDYEPVLARLVTLRNELVHVYDEKRAKGIYEEIKTPVVLQTLKAVLKKIKGEFSPLSSHLPGVEIFYLFGSQFIYLYAHCLEF